MTRTYAGMAETLEVPFCPGGCGITAPSHEQGFAFLGVVHWRERRWTRAGSKRFLMICAALQRKNDPEWLNDDREYDWFYLYWDSVTAQRMAGRLGFRIPGRLFDQERWKCRWLAYKGKVHLSTDPAVYSWASADLDR